MYWLAALGVALAVLAALRVGRPPAPASARTLLILPVENATGDPGLAFLAHGLGEGLVRRLGTMPGRTVISALGGDWIYRSDRPLAQVTRDLGADQGVASRLERTGDGLRLVTRLLDGASGRQLWTATIAVDSSRLSQAESQIAAAVGGAVLGGVAPVLPDEPGVDPESYRLTLRGWYHLLGGGGAPLARDAFLAAIERDPTNARAWSGLSSVWASLALAGEQEAWGRSEGAARRALALDSTQGTALANLGVVRAVRDGDVAEGVAMIRRAIGFEPSNPELRNPILAVVYRLDGQLERSVDELRLGQQLDPVSPYFLDRLGFGLLCAGHTADALATFRSELDLDPSRPEAIRGVVRSLAWDEALDAWRTPRLSIEDSAVREALRGAQGESGYWAVRHAEGRAMVRALAARSQGSEVSPGRLGLAYLHAGDLVRGLALLEEDARTGGVQIYKLGCHEATDEHRDAPEFRRVRTAYGRLGAVNRSARTDTVR